MVTTRFRQSGEWAQSGEAVVRLVDTGSLEVQTWVPVAALAFVREGGELALEANPSRTIGHGCSAIVPVGDNQSRLYELRLANRRDILAGGAGREGGNPDRGGACRHRRSPRRAGAASGRHRRVSNRLKTESAERVPVTTGIAEGTLIEVDGIAPGDRVVIRGGERLRPGQAVTVQAAPPSQ